MTTETRKRSSYTEDFKREAVALVTDQGYRVSEAARSLDIGANLLGRWRRHFEEEASGARLTADERAVLRQHGMICSMSRKGNCWDNAPVERFFSSLKREWTGDRLYRTRQEAIADVREYVAVYYNSKRLHSTLGYTTPMNYEKGLNKVSGIS